MMGDSHTRAYLKGYTAWSGEALPPMEIHPLGSGANFYSPFFESAAGGLHFTVPELQDMLGRQFKISHINNDSEVVWGFSMGFHSARFFRSDLWQEYAPASFDDGGKRQKISAAVFRRLVEIELQYLFAFLEGVRATGAPVFVVSAPPPPRRHRSFRDDDTRAVAIAVNAAFREVVREMMIARGIPFILPPDEVSDADGLLLPEYYAEREDDSHHASAEYAMLMLPRIIALVEEQGWSERAWRERTAVQ